MPTFRLALLFVYLSYVLLTGSNKQGSGWDPNGLTYTPPPPPPTEQGSGWDPNG
jgi:hypothetical protein